MSGWLPDKDVTDVGMAVPGLHERLVQKDDAFMKIVRLCEKVEKKYFVLGTGGVLDILKEIELIAGRQCLQT